MTELNKYRIDRVFEAPLEMVWRAWTDPEILAEWYGPGVETIIHKFDLTPGGEWLNEMKWGEKSDLSRMVFQEIEPQKKLVWKHYSTDAEWNTIANPMMENWPRELLTTVEFEAAGSKTNVSLILEALNTTEAELACFAEKAAGLEQGWGGGFKVMDEIFARMKT